MVSVLSFCERSFDNKSLQTTEDKLITMWGDCDVPRQGDYVWLHDKPYVVNQVSWFPAPDKCSILASCIVTKLAD